MFCAPQIELFGAYCFRSVCVSSWTNLTCNFWSKKVQCSQFNYSFIETIAFRWRQHWPPCDLDHGTKLPCSWWHSVSWMPCFMNILCVRFFIDFVWSLQVTTLKNKLHVYVFYQIICSAVVIHQSECRFSLFSEKEKRQTEQRSDVGVWQMCNGWRKLIQCWHIWTH